MLQRHWTTGGLVLTSHELAEMRGTWPLVSQGPTGALTEPATRPAKTQPLSLDDLARIWPDAKVSDIVGTL